MPKRSPRVTMKLLSLLAVCLVSSLVVCVQARERYDGHKLIQVHPTTHRQVASLQRLQRDNSLEVDFWSEPNMHIPVDMRVTPESMDAVTQLLADAGLGHTLLSDDVQSMVDLEMNSNLLAKREIRSMDSLGKSKDQTCENIVGTYARFNDINSWLYNMSRKYPKIASVRYVGKTYEGRKMLVMKIGRWWLSKPAIWIDAGIHAREWISTATAIYIIKEMLTKYGSDKDVTRLVDKYNWYILPSANPDGYEYSHDNNRMWRKTRSYNPGSKCRGADPNRNWNYHWGGPSTSTNPCSDIFKGRYAFSEIEARNMKNYIQMTRGNIKMYLSLHAYSQLWLTNWAHTATKPADYKDIESVARAGADAIYKVNGAKFKVGSPAVLLYAVGGCSYDWVKAVGGVKYSYVLELRPNQGASKGFIIPASNIVPSGREIWAGIKAAVDHKPC